MSSEKSLVGIQRYDEFYLPGGDLYCLAENRLFRIHRYFFERESRFFKAQLAVPAAPGSQRIGTAEDNAILLDGVRSEDFAKLLWVFYNPKYSLYEASIEDWTTILELAERWKFAEVKNLAVRELEKKLEFPDIDRIVLYHKFNVDETYLIPRYAALCQREELLTVEEGLRLGMEVVIALTRTRECMRNGNSGGASTGWRSPSPLGVSEKELEAIIVDHFNIKPVEQPTGGWVSLSSVGLALITTNEVQQTQIPSGSSNQRRLLIQPSLISPSPTTLVPEPGTRHREEITASQTPTVPERIERPKQVPEEVAAHEVEDDESGGGGDEGYDSETVKADSENGETHHKSICDEVKVDAVPEASSGSEQKMTEDEATNNPSISTGAPVTVANNSESPSEISAHETKMAAPPIDVGVSSLASLDDGEEEYYDSSEGPDKYCRLR